MPETEPTPEQKLQDVINLINLLTLQTRQRLPSTTEANRALAKIIDVGFAIGQLEMLLEAVIKGTPDDPKPTPRDPVN